MPDTGESPDRRMDLRRNVMSRMRLAASVVVALAIAGQMLPNNAAATMVAQNSTPPASAPIPGYAAPTPLQPGDAFGEQVTLPERKIIYLKGHTNWDTAYDTLVDAFKSLNEYFSKQGLKADGPAMTIYTQTDDTGFSFQAALPVAQAPAEPPKGDLALGQTPSGKALKFVHRGAYDAMDSTYEAITNYLDEKNLEAKDLFIEEYASDPVTTPQDKLVVNVFVPVK
jgi:effector-binding domain-containing protein